MNLAQEQYITYAKNGTCIILMYAVIMNGLAQGFATLII